MKTLSIYTFIRVTFAVLFTLMGFLIPLYSTDSEEDFSYFDGDQKIQLRLKKDYIAEFGGMSSKETNERGLKKFKSTKFVNLYKIDDYQRYNLWTKKNKSISVSPVFEEKYSGRLLALPGGIIVSLDKTYSDTDCQRWFQKHGLHIEKKLPLVGNFYLIKTEPGMDSLELANELKTKEGVLMSTPNFWQEMALK